MALRTSNLRSGEGETLRVEIGNSRNRSDEEREKWRSERDKRFWFISFVVVVVCLLS